MKCKYFHTKKRARASASLPVPLSSLTKTKTGFPTVRAALIFPETPNSIQQVSRYLAHFSSHRANVDIVCCSVQNVAPVLVYVLV